jgi:hypothetical protein
VARAGQHKTQGAMILLMVSSGVRVGAMPSLRIKDIKKLDDYGIYRLSIYPDSKKSRYTTYHKPRSCKKPLDAYSPELERIKARSLSQNRPYSGDEFAKQRTNTKILRP